MTVEIPTLTDSKVNRISDHIYCICCKPENFPWVHVMTIVVMGQMPSQQHFGYSRAVKLLKKQVTSFEAAV